MKTESCFCQSYINNAGKLKDCTCGKCSEVLRQAPKPKAAVVIFEKASTYKLKEELGIHEMQQQLADFELFRKLQGVYNVLFCLAVGVLVVMVWRSM